MKKFGYHFRRNYAIKVIPSKKKKLEFGKLSTRLQKGGKKLDDGTFLNPIKIKERLDKETVTIENSFHKINGENIPVAITVHKGITYLSDGYEKEK